MKRHCETCTCEASVTKLPKGHGIPMESLVGKRVRLWLNRETNRFVEGVVERIEKDCNGTPFRHPYLSVAPYGSAGGVDKSGNTFVRNGEWSPTWAVTPTRDLEVVGEDAKRHRRTGR